MAAILRSGSFLRIFSGFRHSLASNAPRYEALTIQKLQTTHLCPNIIRSFAAQKPLENATAGQPSPPGLDKALYRMDTDIRRTGRISRKDIEDIYGEMKSLKYATSTQSLLLIRCCGNLVPEELPEVRTKLVKDIWETLKQLGIPLDISHYNALLRVYLENEYKFLPTEFLAMLEQSGVEPNRVTYQRLISRYCQDGDIEGATKILEFMKEKDLPVSENIFNALIMGHSRANDLESARDVLGVMQGAGLEPSAETYTMLLVGLAEHGDHEGIAKVLAECEAADIILHDRDLMDVVYGLTVKGHQQFVPQILEKFQKLTGYQQDAINLIYRLLNTGHDEVALQVFGTMSQPQNTDGDTPPVGNFFIKHLVKANTPVPKLIQYCQMFKKEGLNLYAMERALEAALTFGQVDTAMALLRVLKEDGAPLRSHYFWPVILNYAKQQQKDQVYNTVKEMVTLDVPLTLETFKDYVIPAVLHEGDHEAVIAALKDCGMSVPAIINSFIAFHLDKNDVAAASALLSKYRPRVTMVLRRDLATAYVKTGDAVATAAVLGQMLPSNYQEAAGVEGEEAESSGEGRKRDAPDVGGMFLMDVLFAARNNIRPEDLEQILAAMEARGINISSSSASAVQSRLGDTVNDNIISLLEKLSAGDLTLQPITREYQGPLNQMTVSQLELRVKEHQIKNQSATATLSALLVAYAKNKNVAKAEEIKKKLDEEQYPYGVGQLVLLVDMYVAEGNLDEAMTILNQLMAREPEVKLTPMKALRVAQLMIQQDKVDDAVALLTTHAPDLADAKADMAVNNTCWRLLNIPAEKGDVATTRRLMDAALNNHYVEPSNMVLGPLIKAHLTNDNLVGAMDEFERVCKEYKVTPWKQELTQRLIRLEDTARLQKMMDLSIEVHGEMNSLYDLVFGFIECGRVRQARKILETPGLRARHNRLEQRCRRYLDEGKVTELENLVAVTKDLFDIDRNMMYLYLFQAYEKENNCEKALGIWTSMQEESVEPSDDFLFKLGSLLKNNGREVPFVMPSQPAPLEELGEKKQVKKQKVEEKKQAKTATEPANESTPKSRFRKALRLKDLDTALDLKKEIDATGQLSIRENSDLIEGLVKSTRIPEAVELTGNMLVAGLHPSIRVFKYLLNELGRSGDVDNMTFFGKYMSEDLKRILSYDNRVGNAYQNAGRANEYLDNLLHAVDTAQEEDLPSLAQKFPRGGMIGILDRCPDTMGKAKELVEKYAAKGISSPANCMWMHLFTKGHHEEAQEVYNKHLAQSSERLMFQKVLTTARETHDTAMVSKLVDILATKPGTPSVAKGVAYSCWIDVLCNTSKYDEALTTLDGALKHITLEEVNTTALNRLKMGLENSNKTFPYKIPEKTKKNAKSSSSSSSDSDSD